MVFVWECHASPHSSLAFPQFVTAGPLGPDPVYSTVGDYVLYYQKTPSKERELPTITTLNVMGIFVTDVKFLILKAVALWVRQLCSLLSSDSSRSRFVCLLRMGLGLLCEPYLLLPATLPGVGGNPGSGTRGNQAAPVPTLLLPDCGTLKELCVFL